MIKTMNMPKAQGGMSEYTIQKWLKKVGDTVAKDEALFSIAVGKLAKTVGSEFSGVITEIRTAVPNGEIPEGHAVLVVPDALPTRDQYAVMQVGDTVVEVTTNLGLNDVKDILK